MSATKRRPIPLNCSVCGRFAPMRWPYVQTCGGGFTGEPLELVDVKCVEHGPRPSDGAPQPEAGDQVT